MDLSLHTEENLTYLLEKIGDKLSVANRILLDEKDYDIQYYEDLKFLYDLVMKRDTLSPSEVNAFIDELKAIRKSSP